MKTSSTPSSLAAVEIDGIDVIGLLALPGRGIKLPVSAEWDSSEQSFRPARFMGSVYDGTLIVGGHSKDGNFDFIDQLDAGEELTFTDMFGRVFRYTVRKIRHADNARAETLADSESALTLFVKKRSFSHRPMCSGIVFSSIGGTEQPL